MSEIDKKVLEIITSYPIKKVSMFCSRVDGTNRVDSDAVRREK
jgi:hypothetical protein